MTEPRSTFVEAHGLRLHVASWGNPHAPALLLLHGMRDHARSWDRIAHQLCDRFHVIAPDLRGHGDSDWAPPGAYGLADYVFDLADLIDALALTQVTIVAHSLGGAIAVRYAGAFPDRVRALCAIEAIELPIVRDQRRAPMPFPQRLQEWIEEERLSRQRKPRLYGHIAEAESRIAGAHPAFDTDMIAHLARHGVTAAADGGWRWKYDNAARNRAPDDADGRDLDETLMAIACPTLLAYGEESWIPVPPRERLTLIRDHRVMTFPGASHWLHHEARDAFLAALNPFLETSIERRTDA